MEDEGALVVDLDELRQLLLRLLDVDERVARVVEDAEVAIDAHVDARGLEQGLVVRVDLDPTFADQPADRAVGENHARILESGSGTTRAGARCYARGRSSTRLTHASSRGWRPSCGWTSTRTR